MQPSMPSTWMMPRPNLRRFSPRLPTTPNALAGMGYLRMQQANFGGAISFLVQAKQDGSKDPGLDSALSTARFYDTMSEGQVAQHGGDLPLAEKQYRAALVMRPNTPEALEGLGGTLLEAQQPEAAVPIFAQFVKVKPSARACVAWAFHRAVRRRVMRPARCSPSASSRRLYVRS